MIGQLTSAWQIPVRIGGFALTVPMATNVGVCPGPGARTASKTTTIALTTLASTANVSMASTIIRYLKIHHLVIGLAKQKESKNLLSIFLEDLN